MRIFFSVTPRHFASLVGLAFGLVALAACIPDTPGGSGTGGVGGTANAPDSCDDTPESVQLLQQAYHLIGKNQRDAAPPLLQAALAGSDGRFAKGRALVTLARIHAEADRIDAAKPHAEAAEAWFAAQRPASGAEGSAAAAIAPCVAKLSREFDSVRAKLAESAGDVIQAATLTARAMGMSLDARGLTSDLPRDQIDLLPTLLHRLVAAGFVKTAADLAVAVLSELGFTCEAESPRTCAAPAGAPPATFGKPPATFTAAQTAQIALAYARALDLAGRAHAALFMYKVTAGLVPQDQGFAMHLASALSRTGAAEAASGMLLPLAEEIPLAQFHLATAALHRGEPAATLKTLGTLKAKLTPPESHANLLTMVALLEAQAHLALKAPDKAEAALVTLEPPKLPALAELLARTRLRILLAKPAPKDPATETPPSVAPHQAPSLLLLATLHHERGRKDAACLLFGTETPASLTAGGEDHIWAGAYVLLFPPSKAQDAALRAKVDKMLTACGKSSWLAFAKAELAAAGGNGPAKDGGKPGK